MSVVASPASELAPVAAVLLPLAGLTVATLVFVLVHATVWFGMTLPRASFTIALNVSTPPMLVLAGFGVTVTVAGAAGVTLNPLLETPARLPELAKSV